MVRNYVKKDDREAEVRRRQANVTFLQASNAYKRKLRNEGKFTRDTEVRLTAIDTKWGAYKIKDITNEEVQSWCMYKFKGLRPSTVNRNVSVMISVMNHAVNEGMIASKPKLSMRRVNDERTSHLELEEIIPVVNYVRQKGGPLMGFLVLLLIDTGMRLGEARALQWRDLREDWITIRNSKYGHSKTKMRMIPTSPRLLTYMQTYGILPLTNDKPQTSVICSRWNTSGVEMSRNTNVMLREACVALGCGCGDDIRVHDLRHTFAFMCASSGADLGDLRDLLGHSNMNITMRYRGFIRTRAASIIRQATLDAGIEDNLWKQNPTRIKMDIDGADDIAKLKEMDLNINNKEFEEIK